MVQGHADDAFLQQATEQLHERFEIEHVTLQVMRVPFTTACAALAPSAAAGGLEQAPGGQADEPPHGHTQRGGTSVK